MHANPTGPRTRVACEGHLTMEFLVEGRVYVIKKTNKVELLGSM